MLSESDRKQRARLGGYGLRATHDPLDYTKAARQAFQDRFEDQVDPERKLPERERQRRAEAARKLYYARLAYQSAKARAAKKKKAAALPRSAASPAPDGVSSTAARLPNRTNSNDRSATSE